jgi:hypothetical protein
MYGVLKTRATTDPTTVVKAAREALTKARYLYRNKDNWSSYEQDLNTPGVMATPEQINLYMRDALKKAPAVLKDWKSWWSKRAYVLRGLKVTAKKKEAATQAVQTVTTKPGYKMAEAAPGIFDTLFQTPKAKAKPSATSAELTQLRRELLFYKSRPPGHIDGNPKPKIHEQKWFLPTVGGVAALLFLGIVFAPKGR